MARFSLQRSCDLPAATDSALTPGVLRAEFGASVLWEKASISLSALKAGRQSGRRGGGILMRRAGGGEGEGSLAGGGGGQCAARLTCISTAVEATPSESETAASGGERSSPTDDFYFRND
ncbi:hypothetical protein SKAU_G00330620 [Synaphobranchus kaupii]|uniref:Uncharacterized protein n=1 Tax=Synaphobranchus kaupii TaxID=118154 RepID=A0A9Q1IIG2_SYNKA|nr:hypothetical protein SKAU_G00330620 [Synaphobranchus kaupii]